MSTTSDAPAESPEPGPSEQLRALDSAEIAPAIESVLLVIDTPTAAVDIARAIGITAESAVEHLVALAHQYDEQDRGFLLMEAAGGWRLYTREEFAPYVERFVLDGQRSRLTQAALETLAVVAYRQPVTRARVSAIRGVNVDGVIKTLLRRALIELVGNDADTGGEQFVTTPLFLEKLGLRSLDELPPIAPLLPEVDPDMDERLESAVADLDTIDSE